MDATDSKGEAIHQTLMPKKMERLDQSQDFRPFKFRIQAFTTAFSEMLAAKGFADNDVPVKRIRNYLWTQPCVSRFNDDGKKAKVRFYPFRSLPLPFGSSPFPCRSRKATTSGPSKPRKYPERSGSSENSLAASKVPLSPSLSLACRGRGLRECGILKFPPHPSTPPSPLLRYLPGWPGTTTF